MKSKLFLIAATLIVSFSCKQEVPAEKTENPPLIKTEPTEEEKNTMIAGNSFEAFNEHNWEKHASYFSDSCMNLDPSYGAEYVMVNRKDKAAKYKEMEGWSPDIKDSITYIFAQGNKVCIQFVSSGTAKTEKGSAKWSLPICCVFTIKNGLIVCDETYYNRGK